MTKVGDTLSYGLSVEEIQKWIRENRGFGLVVDGDAKCLRVVKAEVNA